ncbi:hypothetical protein ACEQ8H_007278 [Pleosporales sp. CAS-2024a]
MTSIPSFALACDKRYETDDATPDPESDDEIQQDYQWECEELRNQIDVKNVEQCRQRISDSAYWKIECHQCKEIFVELLWRHICNRFRTDEGSSEDWRSVARCMQKLLLDKGVPLDETMEFRITGGRKQMFLDHSRHAKSTKYRKRLRCETWNRTNGIPLSAHTVTGRSRETSGANHRYAIGHYIEQDQTQDKDCDRWQNTPSPIQKKHQKPDITALTRLITSLLPHGPAHTYSVPFAILSYSIHISVSAMDLSEVVLFLGCFEFCESFADVDNILTLSEDSRYEFKPPDNDHDATWKGGQPTGQEWKPPFLCLRFEQDQYDLEAGFLDPIMTQTKLIFKLLRTTRLASADDCFESILASQS